MSVNVGDEVSQGDLILTFSGDGDGDGADAEGPAEPEAARPTADDAGEPDAGLYTDPARAGREEEEARDGAYDRWEPDDEPERPAAELRRRRRLRRARRAPAGAAAGRGPGARSAAAAPRAASPRRT